MSGLSYWVEICHAGVPGWAGLGDEASALSSMSGWLEELEMATGFRHSARGKAGDRQGKARQVNTIQTNGSDSLCGDGEGSQPKSATKAQQ